MENKEKLRDIFKVLGCLIVLIGFAGCKNEAPSAHREVPKLVVEMEPTETSPQKLAEIGKMLVFGTDSPQLNEGGRLPIGKGQCPFCHMFVIEQKADRCPNLMGIEALSHKRIQEDRYKIFADKYASNGEPNTGMKPHAQSGGGYLIESLYCPSCYVPLGLGIQGSDDMESAMLIINRLPVALTDFEIVAVVAYLQAKDAPGDFSKVTAKRDWERYFGKKLVVPSGETSVAASPSGGQTKAALPSDTPEQIIQKMGCFACHKIPQVEIARTGTLGPLLIQGTTALHRINSPEYQKAVRERKARATTPKEYVIESILDPDAFIVPGFKGGMPRDYRQKFTVNALENLADFLLTLDEDAARKEGLDRHPDEKEGSLLGRN